MKKILLQVDTTRDVLTDWAGSPFSGLSVVNGDTALICARFTESVAGVVPLDLSGALALRVTVKSARTSSATLWTFQDAYNGGNYPAGEILASGYVTWLVSFSDAAIDTAIGTGESAAGYLELSYLDAGNNPQTLTQIPLTIYQQEDTGAEGTPPPTRPTYLTASEIALSYVANTLFDANTIIAATADNTPAALTVGEQTVVGRLTGGNIKALSTAELSGLLSGTSPTFATVNATTFDTNVAAAGVTLAGTTLSADGTDADISISVTPKGTGSVVISKVDIDAGTIDGTTIGATTPAAGTFMTLTTSGNYTFSGTTFQILANTADGADSKRVILCGGGDSSSTRGAQVALHGNEHATLAGDLILAAGNVSGGEIALQAGGATVGSITGTGLNGCVIGATTPAAATVTSLTLGTDNYIYLNGSASVDGSIRMSYLTSADAVLYEKRVAGAWVAKQILEMT
jgi:hypothetical protein